MRRSISATPSGHSARAPASRRGAPVPAAAATCTADDFAAAVDKSGAQLRAFNAEALPKLRDKLKELKDAKGWGEPTTRRRASTASATRARRSSTPTPRS